MQYTIQDYKRELKLTLENTERLYKVALGVKDFDWQGEEIKNLYMATWATINDNAGQNVAPTLYTDFDVREVHEVVADTASTLQHELVN